jgi:hypothetical protein
VPNLPHRSRALWTRAAVLWLGLGAAALGAGCPHAPAQASVTSNPAAIVPSGCERSVTGRWAHAQDARFLYEAADNGHTLTLTQLGPPPANASADAGVAGGTGLSIITLERTPQGFTGQARATVTLPDKSCEVSFPTEVLFCSETELRLRSTPSRALDASCQVAPLPTAPWVEQRLKRIGDR